MREWRQHCMLAVSSQEVDVCFYFMYARQNLIPLLCLWIFIFTLLLLLHLIETTLTPTKYQRDITHFCKINNLTASCRYNLVLCSFIHFDLIRFDSNFELNDKNDEDMGLKSESKCLNCICASEYVWVWDVRLLRWYASSWVVPSPLLILLPLENLSMGGL